MSASSAARRRGKKRVPDVIAQIVGNDKRRLQRIAAGAERLRVAEEIVAARTRAGISQAELARRLGTTQSAIARLEGTDYAGHSMQMLQRIAAELGERVEVRFVPLRKRRRTGRM